MSRIEKPLEIGFESKPSSAPSNRTFRLRTLFAFISFVAVLLASFLRDWSAVFLFGLPIALIGFALVGGRGWGMVKIGSFFGWAIVGAFFYIWPYSVCPIALPPTAHKLYVANEGFWIAYHIEVRFDASVSDCIATAERVKRNAAEQHGYEIGEPIEINRKLGKFPPGDIFGQRRKWWLNTESIQNGLYYPGGGPHIPEIWIDTDRGVFYYRVTD